MYSPSLLAMLTATTWPDREHPQTPASYESAGQLINLLYAQLRARPESNSLCIPVTSWTNDSRLAQEFFGQYVAFHRFRNSDREYFFGRVPVDRLVRYFEKVHWKDPDQEYVDLGTPLEPSAVSSNKSLGICQTLLGATNTVNPKVRIGVVDQGKLNKGAGPNDFGGQLKHAVTTNIELSTHALDVLSVILERTQAHNGLADVAVECALVMAPPAAALGLACFQHDNVVELQHALKALDARLQATTEPWCVNMSMGTHVGPHNGESPIEEFVDQMFVPGSGRFFTTSTGNDGQRGIAAFRRLQKDVPEDVILRTGSVGCPEILVEFWWREAVGQTMTLEVMVRDASGAKVFPAPLGINSRSAATTMSYAPANQFGTAIPSTLFHARCRNDMSCAAFAISATNKGDLADLDFEFRLICDCDRIVNSWITICEDRRSTFVAGSTTATSTAPSSAKHALSVAGVDSNGMPWPYSSRGPAGAFDPPAGGSPRSAPHVPRLAHLVELRSTGVEGTSFSSARACADGANVLASQGGGFPNDATALMKDILRQQHVPVAANCDSRIGYGAIVR